MLTTHASCWWLWCQKTAVETTTTKLSSTTATTTKAAGEEDKENKLLQTEKRLERAACARTNYGLRDKDARKLRSAVITAYYYFLRCLFCCFAVWLLRIAGSSAAKLLQ